MINNDTRFEEFFSERVRERGFDLKKLSEASGIAVKHLEALASGNFQKLPAEPYFRGYLNRLGQLLGFDPEIWWKRFKEGGFVKSAGAADSMPKNRFMTKANMKILWGAFAALAIIIYLAIQLPGILGKPSITINFPQENPATVFTQELTLMGTVENASELRIEGEVVPIGEDGAWSKTVLLASSPGPVPFKITAKKFLGSETSIIQQIIYQPAPTSTRP
ncbi:MAG: helix-turn-helix domain-containing protein [Patescibacteria group bacterium]